MKILTRGLVLLFLIVLVGCESSPPAKKAPQDTAGDVLRGEHQLRKMFTAQGKEESVSGGFFLIFGGISSESRETANVKFAWQMRDGAYALSSLPLEKFRVKFDNSKETPTIKFRWRPSSNFSASDVQKIIENNVIYALITCKESDWPPKIQLPMN